MKDIPVHKIQSQSSLDLEFNYAEMRGDCSEIIMKSNKNVIHRDEYFMFMFCETASAVFTIDFETIHWQGETVFYVRPGQIHFASSLQEIRGWSLAIDPVLVQKEYKEIFEEQLNTQKPITLNPLISNRMRDTARLLYSIIQSKPTTFGNNMVLNLANLFIGIIAEQYAQHSDGSSPSQNRSILIAHQFKKQLMDNFKTTKKPSEYAKLLNYSLSHLNESVKSATGFSVSRCIQQQVILEAKRLLYYTNLDIKEIAYKLGYEDHAYFSRLFSKNVGMSPNTFRQKFHE